MKGVVWEDVRELRVKQVDDAEIEKASDVLLRITSSAMCGTDLHIYEGRMGEPTGMVIGHEPLGVVEEVGRAVVNVLPGDRVVVPTHICCGFCPSCAVGRNAECLMSNPGSAGAAGSRPVTAVNSVAVQVPVVESMRRSPPRRGCRGRLGGI